MSETTLTSAEKAYFDSRGEKAPEPEAQEVAQTETAASPEPVATETDTPEPGEPGEGKRVPLAALHEERARRKEETEARKKLEADLATFKAEAQRRLDALQQAWQQPPQQPTQPQQPPDPAVDPLGYVRHVEQRAMQAEMMAQTALQTNQQQQQVMQLRNWASSKEAEFKAATPDYDAAIQHLRNTRVAELQALGLDQNAVNQALEADIYQIAMMAARDNANPAERVYQIAKARGFAPPAAQPAAPSVEMQVETIERGQRMASRVPSNGASPQAMTVERLLSMPAGEFDAWVAKHPRQARQLMGE